MIDLGLDRNQDNIKSWINKHDPWFPVVQDVNGRVFSKLKQANSIPQTFIVNCDGTLVDSFIGVWSKSKRREVEKTIKTAMKTKCS